MSKATLVVWIYIISFIFQTGPRIVRSLFLCAPKPLLLVETTWFNQHNLPSATIGSQGFIQFTVCGICHLFPSVHSLTLTEDILDTCLPTYGLKSLILSVSLRG